MGYIMADGDTIPSYHEVRLKQTCPELELSWVVLKGIPQKGKHVAKMFEKKMFEELEQFRFRSDKELFRLELPLPMIFESATRIGLSLLREYEGKEMIIYEKGILVFLFLFILLILYQKKSIPLAAEIDGKNKKVPHPVFLESFL